MPAFGWPGLKLTVGAMFWACTSTDVVATTFAPPSSVKRARSVRSPAVANVTVRCGARILARRDRRSTS